MAGNRNSQGFSSKSQWRLFFARPSLKRYAHQKAHKTQAARGGVKVAYRSLPDHAGLAGKLGVGRVKTRLRVRNKRG